MKRNPILFILLVILIAQPLLSVGFGPSAATTAVQPDDVIVPAQGTRLDPGDHTDHVPILIDGTGDFIAQGWPGAGTSGDPYVISGLNITYDIGLDCISILNTDAYFVIRDCYVDQKSANTGIKLINTSHATLEYLTVESADVAIFALNANNTEFRHLLATGVTDYALDVEQSNDCILESSTMVSVDTGSVVLTACDTFTMSGNTMTPHAGKYGVYALDGNSFSSTNDEITQGHSMRIENSNYSIVTGLTIYAEFGVILVGSHFCQVFDCDIIAYTYDGIYIDTGHGNTVSGNTIDATRYGMYVTSSNDTTYTNNIIEECGDAGIYLQSTYDSVVTFNEIEFVDSGDGIYAWLSDDIQIEGNTITDANDEGITIVASDNGVLLDNFVTRSISDGISLTDSNNWSISENEIIDSEANGIVILGGAFTDVWSNVISQISEKGLYVDTHGMFEAWENTITDSDIGMYITNSDETYIRNNDVYGALYGMYIGSSENNSIDENRFYDCIGKGIDISSVTTSSFSGNQIFAAPSYGIYLSTSTYLTFLSNFLTECGFFGEFDINIEDMNHTFTGNTVNDLPVYYALNDTVGSIDGSLYGQIILVACNDTTISGGTFEKATAPVLVYYGYGVDIEDATMIDNVYGIALDTSNNNTISNVIIENGHSGIYVKDNYYSSITDVTVRNCIYGIRAAGAVNLTVSDSTFADLSNSGFIVESGQSAPNCVIVDSHFYNISSYGIRMLGNSDYWNITNNLFEYCNNAIYASDTSTDYASIIGNEIYYSSNYGIYFSAADYSNIKNNTILWSFNYALYVTSNAWIEAGWQICYNTFGLSGSDNAYDGRNLNVWDDEVDTGNWWSDYSGTGTYPIAGAGAVDNYPMRFLPIEPIMNELLDISYAEGTTGNELSWNPYDNYLKDYMVTIDGAFWEQDAVSDIEDPEITVNIDELSYGTHTLVITVYDIDMNSVSDTVVIMVYDDIDPTINTPVNFEIFLGIAGNQIVWDGDDLNPDNYVVWMDGSEFASGSWTGGEVSVSLDGLSEGAHDFTMIVYDVDGNSASDLVSILVINDATDPTIDSPEDIVFVAGSTGNRIIWTPLDEYPESFEIEFNETIVLSGDWGGGRIILDLDNLTVGMYNFTITVWDGGQASVPDTVSVQVIPYEGWTPELPPPDFTLLIIAGVGITGAIVVIGLIYFFKIKKPKAGGA